MEKLIELLREYIRSKYEFWEYWVYLNKQNKLILEKQNCFMGYWLDEEWYEDIEFWESIIISKQFEFIKWLVENDKINRKEVHEKIKELGKDYWWFDIYSWIAENCLLMLLAIQDEPIRFLCEILK